MNVSDWIAAASVVAVLATGFFSLRYTAHKDEREQERANADAARQAVADARSEWDKSKSELIADRDYYRKLADERQAQINELLSGRRHHG